MRRPICLALALLLAGQAAPRAAGGAPQIDLERPSQETYKDWPSSDLLQRSYWMPWSFLAFERARLFDRPVLFLLTVPWSRPAQKMQDVLADPEVLRTLNEGYISVFALADRRPDIQIRYQTGAWPVVAWLLPDGNPILTQNNPRKVAMPITTSLVDAKGVKFLLDEGLTYYGRQGKFLKGIGQVWAAREGGLEPVPGTPNAESSDRVARWLLANADQQSGGFGLAPKFLVTGLTEYASARDERMVPALSDHARATLDKLIASPLYDRKDGGLHRLAAAPQWGAIQYEKLLQVNVDLIRELTFAMRLAPSPEREQALRQTVGFVTTVLARPEGGFYQGQEADPLSDDGGGYWTAPAGADPAPKSPPLDKLVLAGPNALAGAALLRAAAVLGDADLERAGRAALDLVLARSWAKGQGVVHVVEPAPEPFRFLSTQADVAFALLDAYETTGEQRYLEACRAIVDFTLATFAGKKDESALRDHPVDPGDVGILANPRHPMDDNALLARVMIRLSWLGQGDTYRDHALSILGAYAGDMTGFGVHGVKGALAIEETLRDPLVIRIHGAPADPASAALRRAASAAPWTWTLIRAGDPQGSGAELTWHGRTLKVSRPDELPAAVRDLTGAGS